MKITDNLHAFIWRDMTQNNCNTYLINGPKKILIDPGHRHLFGQVEQQLAELGLSFREIDLVILTHGHPDHMEAVGMFEKPTLSAISKIEVDFFRRMGEHYQRYSDMVAFEPDFFLDDGNLKVGKDTFQVLVSPGHSPGSICLYRPDSRVLITGDVVFNQGIGRTDIPGGDGKLLKQSIQRLSALEVETLLPGHGGIVMGREEVRSNFQLIEKQWFGYLI